MTYINFSNNKFIALTTTTKLGNMAFQVGNNPNEVIKNREALAETLNIKTSNIIYTFQSHSDITQVVTSLDLSSGEHSFESGISADALYTKDNNLALAVFHADCVPLFLYHPSGIVGIIHAGFIGTLKHIAYKSILYISNKENIDPSLFKIIIGPARRMYSYQVNNDEINEIEIANCQNFIYIDNEDNSYFDMISSNILDLIKAGVPQENIQNSYIDTVTDDRCFSAYKKTPVGRMVSLIKLI